MRQKKVIKKLAGHELSKLPRATTVWLRMWQPTIPTVSCGKSSGN